MCPQPSCRGAACSTTNAKAGVLEPGTKSQQTTVSTKSVRLVTHYGNQDVFGDRSDDTTL